MGRPFLMENAMGTHRVIDASSLVDRDGIRYEQGSDFPFTGVAVVYFPSGMKKMGAEFRDGKENGKFAMWGEDGLIEAGGGSLRTAGKWERMSEEGTETSFDQAGERTRSNMKTIRMLAVLSAVLAFPSFGQDQKVEKSQLVERDGLIYEENSETPFTGKAFSSYENGQKEAESEWRGGKLNGKATDWYENGKKKSEAEFKDGKQNGKRTECYENGQKKAEGEMRDDKQDGKWTKWDENGKKESEGEWRDGKRNGRTIFWYENGQTRSEGEYRDDEPNGKCTTWYPNGKKKSEGEWRNGVEVSRVEWDENGNLISHPLPTPKKE